MKEEMTRPTDTELEKKGGKTKRERTEEQRRGRETTLGQRTRGFPTRNLQDQSL